MGLLDIRRRILLNTPHLETASGNISTFETDMVAPLHKLTVGIEPVQDLSHGNPSPDNICPIEGWEGAKIPRTGKNLWGGTVARDGIIAGVSRYNNTVENAVGIIHNSAIVDFFTNGVKFKDNTAYTFVITGYNQARSYLNMLIYYTDGTFLRPEGFSTSKQTLAFVTNPNKTVAGIKKYGFDGTAFVFYDECGIFEGVLTADDFTPYEGTTIPITFTDPATGDPMTVYGGDLTINSDGSGVIANGKHLFDVTSGGSWTRLGVNGDYTSWYKNVTFSPFPAGDAANDLCNMLQPVSVLNATNLPDFPAICLVRGVSSSIRLSLPTAEAATSQDVNTWLTNNAVQVLYDRILPANTEIETDDIVQLRGQNNMWANTGAVRAYYWKHGGGGSSQDYTLLEEYLAKWFFTEDFYIPNESNDGAFHFYHSIRKLNIYSGSGSSYKTVNVTGSNHVKRTGGWNSIALRDTDFVALPQILKDSNLNGKVVRLHIHKDIQSSGTSASGIVFRTNTDTGYVYSRHDLGTGNDILVTIWSDTINTYDDMAIFVIVRSRPHAAWLTYYFTIDDE